MCSMRNVGLIYPVDKEFFKEILNSKRMLDEDHMNCYLSILATNPTFAGVVDSHNNIAIAPSYFMVCILHYNNMEFV